MEGENEIIEWNLIKALSRSRPAVGICQFQIDDILVISLNSRYKMGKILL